MAPSERRTDVEEEGTDPALPAAAAPPRSDATRSPSSSTAAASSAQQQRQPAPFATPPRPTLQQPGYGPAPGVMDKGKNRLLELREPDRARVQGRERTNNVPPVSYPPQPLVASPAAGGSGGADGMRSRPLGAVVSFEGLGYGEGSPADVDSHAAASTSASGGTPQHHHQPSQSTPGSANHAPLFAEQFSTPLRRRLRTNSPTHQGQASDSPLAARVPTPPNGDEDDTDDLYRGPQPPPEQSRRRTFRFDTSGRQLDEDAVSLRSMSTSDSSSTRSSSSSSSRASVVSFVVGAFEAVGRGLGVIGSASSGSSSSSSSSSSSGGGRRWHRKRSRRRSSASTVRGADLEAAVGSASRKRSKQQSRKKNRARHRLRRLKRLRAFSVGSFTTSRRSSTSSGSSGSSSTSRSRSSSTSSSSDDEPLGRRKVAGTREFRLMLPSGPEEEKPAPNFLSPPTPAALSGLPVPLDEQGGMIVTRSLDEVIMTINRLRSAEFQVPTPPPPQPHSGHVPPIAAPTPQAAFPHVIQVPPTAYDVSRPLTPSQILNIAVPAHPPPLELAQAHAQQPTAIPSRLLGQTATAPRSPDLSPSGSRSSSLRREVLQQLPHVQVDGPTPLPSPGRETPAHGGSPAESSPPDIGSGTGPNGKDAWWLDVSCPTWEDMRSLGELLQLHPLTLEDILQQDPREKLEVFAALDYYLISFRALDESYFRYTDDGPDGTAADVSGSRGRRKGRGKVEIVEDRPGKEGLEGVGVGGINLYIVVMRDGVVSFHFEDVKKHVSAVTQRVQALEPGFHLSSDWIAHMFMDSMVDVFMPLIDFIEDEADLIDSQIVHHDAHIESPLARLADAEDAFVEEQRRRLSQEEDEREAANAAADGSSASSDDFIKKQKEAGLEAHELEERARAGSARPDTQRPSPPHDSIGTTTTLAAWIRGRLLWLKVEKGDFILLRRLALAFYPLIARVLIVLSLHPAQRQARQLRRAAKRGSKVEVHDFDRKAMLKQMVGMRRLVTGLNRLLVPKMEVIGRLRKRAADMRSSARLGEDVGEQMSTYFGDIQDHILSMQQTLAYGEHVLSQSQQAYLSQLNITLASVKNSSQSSILALSIVTIGVLPLQIILGINSVNLTMPKNGDPGADPQPPAPYNLWGIILAVISVVGSLFVLLVRQWKRGAKVKYQKKREIFG